MLPLIVPAILTENFESFKEQVNKVTKDFSSIQIDVMDGLFVNNKSFVQREQVNDVNTEAYFELHLMVEDPLTEISMWKDVSTVQSVVFHIEAETDVEECIRHIRNHGWKAGLALNPETPLEKVKPYLNLIDEVLFMTVHPGQQGSSFIPEVLEKIKEFSALGGSASGGKHPYPDLICSADGGINEETIKSVIDAGANKLYVGSALFKAGDPEVEHERLVQALEDITI
jgi:ribulose-phosphate 3-epimerase